jgi:hypothetical protein
VNGGCFYDEEDDGCYVKRIACSLYNDDDEKGNPIDPEGKACLSKSNGIEKGFFFLIVSEYICYIFFVF